MARRARGYGLTAYFGLTAFDIDARHIRETNGRAYLEHRLAQVDLWLIYLTTRLDKQRRQLRQPYPTPPQMRAALDEAMDLAYLQTMRQALYDALSNDPPA